MKSNEEVVAQEPQEEPGIVPPAAACEVHSSVISVVTSADPETPSPAEQKPFKWPRLSEALLIGLTTVTAYFVALAHQSGYNAVFGIPEGLIDVSPEALFHSLFPMLLAFGLTAWVLFVRIAWLKDDPGDSKFWKDVLGVFGLGSCGGVATSWLLADSSLHVWGYHAFLTMCPFLPFLLVDGVEQVTKKSCSVAPQSWLPWVGAFGFMIWSFQLSFWVGAYQARDKIVFPVLSGQHPKVVLAIRGDRWITAPLLPGNHVGRPLTLFRPNDGERLHLEDQAIGPLRKALGP